MNKVMATTTIHLNKEIVDKAQRYAASEGKSLATIIEDYLTRLTFKGKKQDMDLEEVPDIVLSLLGAGAPLSDDDINGRKAYYDYIGKKHQ